MLRIFAIALLLGWAVVAPGESRWCSITGRASGDKFTYPPIARAARLSGVVLGRIKFLTNGKVVDFEQISGARLLGDSIKGQLMQWTVQTDATGDEPCQALVIAEFEQDSSGPSESSTRINYEPGSVLRISSYVAPLVLDVVISDPAPLKGWPLFRARVKWKMMQMFRRKSAAD